MSDAQLDERIRAEMNAEIAAEIHAVMQKNGIDTFALAFMSKMADPLCAFGQPASHSDAVLMLDCLEQLTTVFKKIDESFT